jgi:hypothetical protein
LQHAGGGDGEGQVIDAELSAMTPAVILADTVFRTYTTNLGLNQQAMWDEQSIYFTRAPILQNAFISYVNNPEAMNVVSETLGTEYSERLMGSVIIRDNLYIGATGHLVRTVDSGIGRACGLACPHHRGRPGS